MVRRWSTFFYSTLFLVGLLAALGFMALAFAQAYYGHYRVEQEIAQLKDNKERLQAKKFQTIELLDYVKSGSFVEHKARTELNMIKPGEHEVIITTSIPTSTGQATSDMIETEVVNNSLKWWRYFFKKH
jgi:cell division protein FtsB